jgi:ribosome maturation factor RimP
MEGDGSPLFKCIEMIEKSKIENAVNDWISNPAVFLVEVKSDRENNIRVFMDSDEGFTIEQCVELTRFLESSFDRDIEDYQLTVSSYGITQPFVSNRQYLKYIGRPVDIDPEEGKPFSAVIRSLEGDVLTVERKLSRKEEKEGADPVSSFRLNELKSVKPSIVFN